MSIRHFQKPTSSLGEKQEVTLTQPIPAFRANDIALERVWRTMHAKCAEVGEPTGRLTITTRGRSSRNGPREDREYEYESIADLRRSPSAPVLLRVYTLSVSSPWGDDYRRVRLSSYGYGAASLTAIAPDADWCREVIAAVLDHLRAHTAWYSPVHSGAGTVGLFVAPIAMVAAMSTSMALGLPVVVVHGMYWSALAASLAVLFWRERLFPPADIRLDRRAADVVPHDRPPTPA